jgi:glycosyltransferase involved in cell wall biosynthesis
MSIQVLYDFLQVRGGAERVSQALAGQLPARLIVHAVDPTQFSRLELGNVETLSRRPLARNPLLRGAAAWRAFRHLQVQADASAALFSGHYAPLAWRAFPAARRVLYLHGPPLPFRYGHEDSALMRWPDPLRRALLRLPMARLADAFQEAANAMDVVLANSRFVANAFEAETGRAATVLPPPVDARFFGSARASEGYWISIARHEPMKCVDRVVDAFIGLPEHQLIVAGSGGDTAALRRRAAAAPNIRFVGALDTAALAHWLGGARASVHVSRAEPFGLAIAESLAAGTPVLTCDEGAAADLVLDGHNGRVLAANPDVAAIRAAVQSFGVARDVAGQAGRVSSSVGHLRPENFVAAIRAALLKDGKEGDGCHRIAEAASDA